MFETYTEEQYKSATELCRSFSFKVWERTLLTHRDIASYKPTLEGERLELLAWLKEVTLPVQPGDKEETKKKIIELVNSL